MNKYHVLFLMLLLLIHCQKIKEVMIENGLYSIKNKQIEMTLDKDGCCSVYKNIETSITRCLAEVSMVAIVSNGEEIPFVIDKVLFERASTFIGKSDRYFILGHDTRNLGYSMKLSLDALDDYQTVLLSQVKLSNSGNGILDLDTLIMHRYSFQAQANDVDENEAPFWAFCGGTYSERFDWIDPMHEGFIRENPMHPKGGNPYTGIWNPAYGIGIMSLELRQEPLVFPVKCNNEGVVDICIKEPINRQLSPAEEWQSTQHAVLVHDGDVYNGMTTWSHLLQNKGLQFPESPASCYDPIWCGWGYEDDYTSEELLSTLPVAGEMGIKWVVVDAGWYDRDTFWDLHPDKYPDGDASMRAFTDSVRALGMRPKLWFSPASAPYGWPEGRWGKKGPLVIPDEKMLILNEDGNTIDDRWFGTSYLCPAYNQVIEESKAFVRKAMQVWGFDGFKIDGGYLNEFPPCYNPAHHHESPLASIYAGPKLLKAMYDEAIRYVPDAVFEFCPCGTNCSIYNLSGQNQTVASDPLSSWQVRHRGKIYHALLNSKIAYYGDHVELSDNKNDFASTIGIGGVPGTKFTLVETRQMEEGSKLLTAENKNIWKKFIEAYNKERPSEGIYLNCYDIAYDTPEIHVIKKGDILYYGIFIKEPFSGEIDLKGLSTNHEYRVVDYVNYKILSENLSYNNNKLHIDSDEHILLKAIPR